MKTNKIFSLFGVIIYVLFCVPNCFAQTQSDWVIRDFESTITVNKDSSLLIEERITADADSLPDKHGIFRVLPTQANTENETIKNPVILKSITDFAGKPLKFSTINNNADHTITWKIGDADVAVSGLNYYKITYLVKNAVRFGNPDFDELYWNLSGNFWKIPIDKISTKIIFPAEVSQNSAQVDYYTGQAGSLGKDAAVYNWLGAQTLEFDSTRQLAPGEGITASVAVPKNIFVPYSPSFIDLYGNYLWFLVPLLAFVIFFIVWFKYGKDPRVDKTVIPEFEIPENLTPMEMGMLSSDGGFKNQFISATIVNLAVKKYLTIEEIKKSWLMGGKDYKLTQIGGDQAVPLAGAEKLLVDNLFNQGNPVLLSSLKKKFYKAIPGIKKASISGLAEKNLLVAQSFTLQKIFVSGLATALFVALYFAVNISSIEIYASLAITVGIVLLFGILMPKRTPQGAELNWRIKGFKLYMETAEKYRSQFNEKENIFEKFLPYAIMFGIAKLWAQKMELIYGKEYFATYHPIWYVGSIGNFDANSFASNLNSLSSSIASSAGTSSGAGGGGFSGGGGGGGGGGGW